ncbi:inactive rhomboid protein 1-like [Oscarella lobularis]|uniref:inactive rhomboid protein 1-like n=1 Tax=Oscarella lobularis TaxID=121494 RepID=UPI00331312AD
MSESHPLIESDKAQIRRNRRAAAAEDTTVFAGSDSPVPPALGKRKQPRRQRRDVAADRSSTTTKITRRRDTFRPYFIVVVTLLQVGLFIYEMVTSDLAPISFTPKTGELASVPSFGSSQNITVEKNVTSNWFIGPDPTYLVHTGAKFTLCMREDTGLVLRLLADGEKEKTLRCCQLKDGSNTCGMVTPQQCEDFSPSGEILGGASQCSDINPVCSGGIPLRPCCIGLDAGCRLTSKAECDFLVGYWHEDQVLCRDVNCLGDICKVSAFKDTVDSPQEADQWYRLIVAIFLHTGVVHIVLVLIFQLWLGITLERQYGWLAVGIIYLTSGIGGYVISGIFDPDAQSVGASGALLGLLGMKFVNLFMSWSEEKNPCCQLINLFFDTALALAIGTTPYVDNFAHVGGFVFGLLTSFLFVPFVKYRRPQNARKQRSCACVFCLIFIFLPLLFCLFFMSFVIFYHTQNTDFCSWCHYINCVPYVTNFCEEGFTSLVPT